MGAQSRGRKLVVAGVEYRYLPAQIDSHRLRLTIWQHGLSGRQAQLIVYLDNDDFWLLFPEPAERIADVNPNGVRRVIEAGIAAGWNPAVTGPAWRRRWEDEALASMPWARLANTFETLTDFVEIASYDDCYGSSLSTLWADDEVQPAALAYVAALFCNHESALIAAGCDALENDLSLLGEHRAAAEDVVRAVRAWLAAPYNDSQVHKAGTAAYSWIAHQHNYPPLGADGGYVMDAACWLSYLVTKPNLENETTANDAVELFANNFAMLFGELDQNPGRSRRLRETIRRAVPPESLHWPAT